MTDEHEQQPVEQQPEEQPQSEVAEISIFLKTRTVRVEFTSGEKVAAVLERGNLSAQDADARILINNVQATLDTVLALGDEITLLGEWTNGLKKKV